MGKAPCCDKANVKRGPWSPEEDSKLKEYIAKYGTGGNWIALPQKMGLKRCGKSCRLRWLNYLRPNIKHGGFSLEEDNIICSLYTSIGSRWSIIAAQLPGRTDNDIKNYWNTRLKKELVRKSKHHQALLASAKQESQDFQRYGTSEHNTSPNLCGPQQQPVALDYHMNNNYTNGPYSDFGHGIICQLFEENCGSTITGSSSSSEPGAFQLNRQQATDWEVSERNSCISKLLLGFGASPVDNCLKHCIIPPVPASGCMNASQLLQSFAHNQYNSDATSQIFYQPSASPVLMDASRMENHTTLENRSATFAQNDISLLFSASSLHEEENCESAWTNTFSAESINWAASGISAELNDSLVYDYMSPGQERENTN